MGLPHTVWLAWWGLVGLFVGSFLNVAIHRLPLAGETVSRPRRSRCPECRRQLTWKENVPVVSWLIQLGRCRGCGWRIPWRYPFVELLTAALWVALALATGFDRPVLLGVQTIVVSGLLVATFVDFDYFEIPDEISIGGIVLAPVASLLVPELHVLSPLPGWFGLVAAGGELTRLGALVTCLCGMAVGGGILLAVGWVGSKVFGRDAMGFGDVKLLAGAGGFIGPGGVLVALMIASLIASIAGVGNILRFLFVVGARHRERGKRSSFGARLQVARIAGRYVPFGPYLAIGIGIVLVAWKDVVGWLR